MLLCQEDIPSESSKRTCSIIATFAIAFGIVTPSERDFFRKNGFVREMIHTKPIKVRKDTTVIFDGVPHCGSMFQHFLDLPGKSAFKFICHNRPTFLVLNMDMSRQHTRRPSLSKAT